MFQSYSKSALIQRKREEVCKLDTWVLLGER